MKRSDVAQLTSLQLKALLYYSRFLVWVYDLKHKAHAALGVYPERRKWILHIFKTRIHLTVSVDTRPEYHWVSGEG